MRDKQIEKAVALRYDSEKDAAPKVTAKGQGLIAERIRALAKESNVPLQQDQILVDYLMALDLLEEIPADLYHVVAEIMAFVYSMDKKY
jgi:flagellar biosynthesis protein